MVSGIVKPSGLEFAVIAMIVLAGLWPPLGGRVMTTWTSTLGAASLCGRAAGRLTGLQSHLRSLSRSDLLPLIFFCRCMMPNKSASEVGGHPGT
jgi:hypothetical protein